LFLFLVFIVCDLMWVVCVHVMWVSLHLEETSNSPQLDLFVSFACLPIFKFIPKRNLKWFFVLVSVLLILIEVRRWFEIVSCLQDEQGPSPFFHGSSWNYCQTQFQVRVRLTWIQPRLWLFVIAIWLLFQVDPARFDPPLASSIFFNVRESSRLLLLWKLFYAHMCS